MGKHRKENNKEYIDKQWEWLAKELEKDNSDFSIFSQGKDGSQEDKSRNIQSFKRDSPKENDHSEEDEKSDDRANSIFKNKDTKDNSIGKEPSHTLRPTPPSKETTKKAHSIFDPVGSPQPVSELYKRESVEIPSSPSLHKEDKPFDGDNDSFFAGSINHPRGIGKLGLFKEAVAIAWLILSAIIIVSFVSFPSLPFVSALGYCGMFLIIAGLVIPLSYLHVVRTNDKFRYWDMVRKEGHEMYIGKDAKLYSTLDPSKVKGTHYWPVVAVVTFSVLAIGTLLLSMDVANHSQELESYINHSSSYSA